jgi:hypothetical protein
MKNIIDTARKLAAQQRENDVDTAMIHVAIEIEKVKSLERIVEQLP